MRAVTIATTLFLAAKPVLAEDLPPLPDNPTVTERLMSARVADRIRKECGELSARIVYAFGEARELKRWALKQGYTEEAVEAFLDDKEQRKRIYALAEEYLTANGATDAAGFCALGKDEIDKKSYIGSFLY
jgi:Family of unknown function (DUF5333)